MFGHYLAGLWEGDGHSGGLSTALLSSHVNHRSTVYNPYIAITFHQRNYPLIQACQHLLGGSIRHKEKENAWVLTLRSKCALYKFALLVNNKCRTPKHSELQCLLHWLNTKPEFISLPLGQYDESILSSNAWLSGFLDADGGFKIRFTKALYHPTNQKCLQKERIALSCVLEQRKIHPKSGLAYEKIMQKIANFFTVPLRESKHNGKLYWLIEVNSYKRLKGIIQYLEKYPLLSSRKHDFHDWCKVYTMIGQKKHLCSYGKKKIAEIKKGMNRKRRYCSWFHIVHTFAPLIIKMNDIQCFIS
jgi:hypothetical protein